MVCDVEANISWPKVVGNDPNARRVCVQHMVIEGEISISIAEDSI
jgi:hypothetical protein